MTCYNDLKKRASGQPFDKACNRVVAPRPKTISGKGIRCMRPIHLLLAVFTPQRFIKKFLMPTYLW
jgi:hypothetical protein